MSGLPKLMVGVPVLARPANAAPVYDSIKASTPDAEVIFLCSPGDDEEIDACFAAGGDQIATVLWPAGPGDFARKHNYGYARAVEQRFDWYFVGADDLVFHPGWYEYALRAHGRAGACVVGTNDMHNQNVTRGWYATHFMVHRDYAECGTIDDPSRILHEGYDHQSVDIEFCQTARFRRTYAHALDSRVEHNHPHWGRAEMGSTYEKALRATHEDQALLRGRQHMWGKR